MLRLANLEHGRVAGDGNCACYAYIANCQVFGVREYVLRHQPAEVLRPIRDSHPDYKCQRFLRRVAVR
eukprot:5307867-Pleurochrysis_carterae.AAC.1